MQYHQLLELVLDASHASVMLYGPVTVRRRFVGAVGDWSLGGGGGGSGGGAGFLAEAPAMTTSASTLAARTVRRTGMAPPEGGWGRPVIRGSRATRFRRWCEGPSRRLRARTWTGSTLAPRSSRPPRLVLSAGAEAGLAPASAPSFPHLHAASRHAPAQGAAPFPPG